MTGLPWKRGSSGNPGPTFPCGNDFFKCFICLFLAVLGLCGRSGFSLVATSRGYSRCGAWVSCFPDSSGCWAPTPQPQASVVAGMQSLAAPRHVDSLQIRDGASVSCTGRPVLHRWPSGKPREPIAIAIASPPLCWQGQSPTLGLQDWRNARHSTPGRWDWAQLLATCTLSPREEEVTCHTGPLSTCIWEQSK